MPSNHFSNFSIACLLLFTTTQSSGQNHPEVGYDKQFIVTTDNDVLAFTGTDRYYTNGLFLKYATVAQNLKAVVRKRINEWEVGQMIFTAYKREVMAATEIDRPVAGYIYGKFSQTTFTDRNKMYSWGLSVGTVGKASFAKEVMDDFHPFVKINNNWWGWIWDYQVKDEVGVNAHGCYAFSLLNNPPRHFQVTPVTNLTLGTTFTNISQSLLFQFGNFNQMHESSYWNAKIESKGSSSGTNRNELFFFYQPQLLLQGYDATIQGGMFRNDKGRIVWPIKPLVFTHHIGASFSTPRYSLSFQSFFETRHAKYQFNNHAYGRIQFGYRFR